ncbi:hypothetical protein ACFL34_05040 [Candidatus Sumerlaeota bacterium]
MRARLLADRSHKSRERGFVFLLALGLMIVMILVAASAGMATMQTNALAGSTAKTAQARLALRSAVDGLTASSLSLDAAKPTELWTSGNAAAGEHVISVVGYQSAPLAADDAVYKSPLLSHQPGDVLVTLKASVKQAKNETLTEIAATQGAYLWNLRGQRLRAIYVKGTE